MKKLILTLFLSTIVYSQYTEDQVLQILKDRDSQWEKEINEVELLVEQQNKQMLTQATLISSLNEQAGIDSTVIATKNQQIDLLSKRDDANEKLVSLVKPKWYENRYIWFAIGFLLGK